MIKFDRIETGDVTRSDWSVNGFLLWVYGSRERETHTHPFETSLAIDKKSKRDLASLLAPCILCKGCRASTWPLPSRQE